MAPLPKGFNDLAAAYRAPPRTFVNIIGVVVDVMPPRQLSNGQYVMTFKLLDKPLSNAIYGSQGVMVRFFQASEALLPKVQEHGDVVLLRNIKMIEYQMQPCALSNVQTEWQVFPSAAIPDKNFSIAYNDLRRLQSFGAPAAVEKFSLNEQDYVIDLKAEMKTAVTQAALHQQAENSRKREAAALADLAPAPKKPRTSGFGEKFQLVKEIQHMKFADLVVKVVRKFPNNIGSSELYVTDYTENRDMFFYVPPEEDPGTKDGDEFGYNKPSKRTWPGPWGYHVLKVNAKGPHAAFANTNVNEGDLVFLRNVKVKAMAVGAQLEGDMWPDDRYPEKVLISKVLSHWTQEVKDLLAREELYWQQRKVNEEKRQLQQRLAGKVSKTEKRRQKKQRQANERAQAAATAVEKNKHVRCSHEEVATTSVRGIVDQDNEWHTNTLPDGTSYTLPFINAQYRTKARIVDFYPKQLEDFAIPALPDQPGGEPSPIDDMDWEPSNASQKYEWYFSLQLQDLGKNQDGSASCIWVHVRHEDAQFLFGNDMEDPQDLRSSPQLLAKLREKLCILWGNLEEKKEGEELSNRPFECCIQEYGIELDDDGPEKADVPFGWKRMYRMFGTTIL